MIRHVLPPLLVGLFLGAAACGGGDDSNPDDKTPGDDAGSSGSSGSSGNSSGGSSSGDGGTEPTRIVCPTPIPAAPDGQLCAVTAGAADKLVIRATVLADDKVYENGVVVVDRNGENGTISCVGCDCEAAGATELACAQGVLSPGLINSHDHMPYNVKGEPKGHGDVRFDHRHDWREGLRGHSKVNHNGTVDDDAGRQYAELRMLMSGVTSLVGSGSAPGLVRNLDDEDADGKLDMGEVDYRTFPLGDSGGTLRADGCNYGNKDKESRLGARIYLPHIAEGIDKEAGNEFKCLSGEAEGSVDLIAGNTSVVHGIGLTAANIATMAQEGAKLVWSPRTNIDLYGQTADVLTYRRLGVTIALGTDWIISGSMNMLRELNCVDSLNKNNYGGAFSDLEIWQMATKNGAIAMGVEQRLGTIAQGYIADLALYRGNQNRRDHRAVIEAGVEDVALVMRGGQPLYGDPNVIDGLASDPGKCEVHDVCTNDKKICAELDTGRTLAAMTSAANPRYPLFPCGTPEREPSCVPARPDEYSGVPSASDSDGDGIPDDVDNCASIFNPRRPLDNNNQPNFDGDEFGDSCDVCPLNEGGTCTSVDPSDRDGDGIPNDSDNCPAVANQDQADTDGDGKGDACDRCPEEPNPGAAVCTATIQEIKQNQKWVVGDVVRVRGSPVLGSSRDGLFLQAPGGGNYSGLFAYQTGANKPAEGAIIDVTGRVADFNGQRQIEALADITVVSEGNALPAPLVVPSSDLAPASQRARELEGTLVAVEGATATSFNEQYVETTMNGGDFLIDDTLFAYAPPSIGTSFDLVRGPLSFRFGAYRINPRRDADLVVDANAPRRVASLTPAALTVPPGGSANLTINLNLPAPAGGIEVRITAPAALVTVPATVVVPEGQSSVVVTVAAVAAEGAGSISAEVDGQSPAAAPIAFNIVVPAQECLIISEVVEGTSTNKALEIYNCGATLDLSNYLLCQANRGGSGAQNQTYTMVLSGNLAAGEVQAYCTQTVPAAVNCVHMSNNVLDFNGNDSLYIVKDNGNGVCNPGVDPVVDAFGIISGPMPSNQTPWADRTYSRCDFTPFPGTGEFDIGTYTASPVNTFDGLGVAPVEGCE